MSSSVHLTTISLSVGYRHMLENGGFLDANVGWSQRSRQHNNVDFVPNTIQEAYGLMDARLTWTFINGKTNRHW